MTDQLDRLPGGVRHLRCDNPGPMTLTGTNTYVIALEEASGGDGSLVAVVDPGPEDAGHRDAIMDAVRGAEATRVVVLLTHHHDDHEGGASALVEALRGRGLAVALRGGSGGDAFADGEMIGDLQVLLAPGHTRDSAAFVLQRDGVDVLFSGDTILGEGSSFVAYPDGDLTAYLATLDALIALVAWLLLRDSSSSHGAAPAPSSSTSSRSAQPRDVPLSGALSGGARTASVRVGGSSYDDAVVPLLTDRQACTAAAQFALDRRYDEVEFTVGATDAQPGGTNMQPEGTTTVTVRVDGSAKQTVTLGGKQAKTLRVPVSGARTLNVDTGSIGCSPALDTAPVALVAGTLRTS